MAPEPGPLTTRVVAGSAAALVVLEVLAYLAGGPASWLAARVWALLGFVTLGTSVVVVARSLLDDLRHVRVAALALVATTAVLVGWGIGGVDHALVNLEATQEAADGLRALEQRDWRYTETAFLGYPARQYLVASAPSLVLGRSLVALRLGFALPFVVGLFLLHAALKRTWAEVPGGSSLAALVALGVYSFTYLVQYLRYYEQTLLPVAVVLNALAWLLIVRDRPSVPACLGLVWTGGLLGASYTPALSAWLLLLLALGAALVTAWRGRHRRWALLWGGTLAATVAYGGLSFLTRADTRLLGQGGALDHHQVRYLVETASIVLAGEPRAFVSPVLLLPLLVFILLSLVGRTNLPSFVIAWWSLATLAAAAVLRGYAAPPPDASLHRALVAAPPLLVAMTWTALVWLRRAGAPRPPAALLAVLVVLLSGAAGWNLHLAHRRVDPSLSSAFFVELLHQAREHGFSADHPLELVVASSRPELHGLSDGLCYFFPHHALTTSVDDLEAALVSGRPLLAWVDESTWEEGRLSAPPGTRPELFRFEHPHFAHRMVRLVVLPPR